MHLVHMYHLHDHGPLSPPPPPLSLEQVLRSIDEVVRQEEDEEEEERGHLHVTQLRVVWCRNYWCCCLWPIKRGWCWGVRPNNIVLVLVTGVGDSAGGAAGATGQYMRDPSNPVFETTASGFRVAGTGQPRLETAARAGKAARSRGWFFDGWKNAMLGRRRPRMGEVKGRRCVFVSIDGHTML